MKPIYENAGDVHVRSNLAYAKTADHKLYYEAAYTNQVTQTDAVEAFKKGTLLIVDGTDYLKPVALSGNIVKTLCTTGNPTEAFDATKTYAVGDCVVKDGIGYKCTTEISEAAAWDATDWTAIDTVDFVEWAAKAAE